ncbi:hypothetical protein A2130_02210 [Candidatus Woesebacteria bacterium GWC2_33_12]|uniref:Spermine synthase n=1 Tax=Candidatus Woesebacteria bacterium GW2011_GWB1_33_22 TaxID=1618566 RepID=A0A0G0BYR2_9BACT|nr:MAG: Spermine synthase [Candidatus Woesebacteria bacterium GW2011_GWC2_33_12]KKP41602.1 MAG: Spermine synthase [Candidatus Woesebacteria bacterium GW2011_GWA2_33_20]KKP44050.1 MAG: Spermine synthase [Candidatus Woesebacteria bacterium GW2011_GWB1_33_22]KKP45711.1 MAG: Spermine synthase [Microgenomates group bacterium GW2011_GWC1_33_28]KKP49573.1 MAG: Spermine synthase [Candidatus Woesebacteria bacterium GW2011_GWA1_33_33]OGM07079.1 MAG: hypothetical protein A2130_02210 [Candidatus Woesebact
MLGTTVLEERDSKYNDRVRVVKTFGMGTYIQCNGLTQSGGIVETIWKQTLRKLRIKKEEIRNILILGLGGGTVAKLLRKKYPKAKIVGVEIDPVMIELGKKYLNLDKYNIDFKITDATKIKIKEYDLVIVDMYLGDKYVDLAGFHPASKITIFNRLYYGDKKQEALEFGQKLKKVFKKVDVFYPTANVMFFCYNS